MKRTENGRRGYGEHDPHQENRRPRIFQNPENVVCRRILPCTVLTPRQDENSPDFTSYTHHNSLAAEETHDMTNLIIDIFTKRRFPSHRSGYEWHKRRKKAMEEKRCYTVNDLQEILGVCKPVIYDLINEKLFRSFKIGGKYMIPRKSFDAWLDGPQPEDDETTG